MIDQLAAKHREAWTANGAGLPAVGLRHAVAGLRLAAALAESEAVPRQPVDLALMVGRLQVTAGYSEFELLGPDGAHGRLSAARSTLAGLPPLSRQAAHLRSLVAALEASVTVRGGDFAAAVPLFDAALDNPGYPEPAERASIVLSRGATHLFLGNIAAARADLGEAAELANATGLARVEFKANHNLGYAHYLAGDLPAALAAMDAADTLEVDVSRSVALMDRARVLMEAGLLTEADSTLERAIELMLRERANADRGAALLARSEVALLLGEPLRAGAHAAAARRLFQRRGDQGWLGWADLAQAQAALRSGRQPGRLARRASELAGSGRLGGDPVRTATAHLTAAEAYLAADMVEAARAAADQLPASGSALPLSIAMQVHRLRAAISATEGDPTGARRSMRAGNAALARAQAHHQSLDVRTAIAVHGSALAEAGLRLALDEGSAEHAYNAIDQWRSLAHGMGGGLRPPADPGLADLLEQLRVTAQDLRDARPGRQTEPLLARQARLQEQIRSHEWRQSGGRMIGRRASLRRAQSLLAARGCAAVMYFVVGERLGAVTLDGAQAQIVDLADWSDVERLIRRVRADLDALAQPMVPAVLRTAVAASLRSDLTRLEDVLVPARFGPDRPLIIVPTRTLGMVPWSSIPIRRGRPTVVSLSLSGWADRLGAPSPEQVSVLAVAGPDLPLADQEVTAVGRCWPTATLVPSAASRSGLVGRALTRHAIVHIAAHGTHTRDNPLFACLRLGDGPLFAYDIPRDEPIASHVVLSACDLGLATSRPGGDLLGMTAALLALGTVSVISAVGRVDDQVAHDTMTRYHLLLRSGTDSATALSAALPEGLDHPAPFVTFGAAWTAPTGR